MEFEIGNRVEKGKGYKFPGIVVGKFTNLDGELRYVVQCTVADVEKVLHIYSGGNLRHSNHPSSESVDTSKLRK